ncbi:hypothetical protein ACFY41_10515 [Streptomyces syringium]|uniref:hypothetical protein n=1 Tax=Streptomyces syringium TaxID=76729 RepID=UPI0036956E37
MHGDEELPEPRFLPSTPGGHDYFAPAPMDTLHPSLPNVYDPTKPPPGRSLPLGVQGPVPANLKIEPKVLTGAAGKADEVRRAFYRSAASLEEPTKAAARGVEEMATEEALKRMHLHWEEQAGLVTAWIENISKSLRMASSDYAQTDHGIQGFFLRPQKGL